MNGNPTAKCAVPPAGPFQPEEVQPTCALIFGIVLAVLGAAELAWAVNLRTTTIGSTTTIAAYLFVYTPLKRYSPLSTIAAAFAGAMPPLIGYAAANGNLSAEAWALAAILFVWQIPHSLAIAWMYRDDYARAGIRMLPVIEPDGKSTTRHIVAFTSTLIPVSLFPVVLGMTGQIYFVGALILGGCFTYLRNSCRDGTYKPPGATGSPHIGSVPSLDYGATRYRPARALILRERRDIVPPTIIGFFPATIPCMLTVKETPGSGPNEPSGSPRCSKGGNPKNGQTPQGFGYA